MHILSSTHKHKHKIGKRLTRLKDSSPKNKGRSIPKISVSCVIYKLIIIMLAIEHIIADISYIKCFFLIFAIYTYIYILVKGSIRAELY